MIFSIIGYLFIFELILTKKVGKVSVIVWVDCF